MNIDNTIIESFKTCEQKAVFRHNRGLVSNNAASIDLVAGQAFASAMETVRKAYYKEDLLLETCLERGRQAIRDIYSLSMAAGLMIPRYSYKTLDGMLGAFEAYMQRWPLGEDGYTPLMIEETLTIEMGNDETYYGKPDMVAIDEHCVVWAIDEKTTGRFSDDWYSQWSLNSQMTGYIALMQESGFNGSQIGGCIIRGIQINKDGAKCIEVQIHRQDWELERWYYNTHDIISRIGNVFKEQASPRLALNYSCVKCDYQMLCSSNEPELLIPDNYHVSEWKPVSIVSKSDVTSYDGC